jgi:hypothetical protein
MFLKIWRDNFDKFIRLLLIFPITFIATFCSNYKPEPGSGFIVADSPDDLTNKHPHLWCRDYGPVNGLWQKAQTTHSEIWNRLSNTARTGPWEGLNRTNGQELMRSAMAFIISKNKGFGNHCQSAIRALNGHAFKFTDQEMEPFYAYCLAYDAIVDDPQTTWLTPSEKAAALATMADVVSRLNLDGSETRRVNPTHNYMVLRAAMHAAGLYNLRGEPGYDSLYNISRQYSLAYLNERVNGLCNAPLTKNGPRPIDGFPYEGPQYGAYQASRALMHRYILEMNEYPNPPTVPDENQSGFSQNYNLAWMALALPGCKDWADVCYTGSHGILQGIRYFSAVNKAVGNDTLAGVGEWFHNEILPGAVGGSQDQGWWQGWEMVWYDASITSIQPSEAGIPLYIHLDDSEFHMYRDNWELYPGSPEDTYVYFRNSAHDGHNFWAEGHSGPSLPPDCTVKTSSHDGGDNGHFGIYRNGSWLARNNEPDGGSNEHNCLTIDDVLQIMKGTGEIRGYEVPELAGTDCIGSVDSDYGHVLDAIVGPAYPAGTVDSYHRYFFVIRNPMYVLVVDELSPGHRVAFNCYAESGTIKKDEGLYISPDARYELMYPQSGFTSSSDVNPIVLTTSSPNLMFLVHPNPSGISIGKRYAGRQILASIGQDDVVYNPSGETYSHGSISGNSKLFTERTDGVIVFQATAASGSQYGISCDTVLNMSVSGRKVSIYIYGTGVHTVNITSPYGVDAFDIQAGQTIEKTL